MTRLFAATFFAAALLPATGNAASEIVPAAPLPFEGVNLRMTVDDCVFDPSTVIVATVPAGIEVRLQNRNCFAPGQTKVVDVRLGSYPPGAYNVRVVNFGGVLETLRFDVQPRAEIAIFPPPAHPLTDYSGLWWNPQESGWGLSLHQSPVDALFGALFIYDAANAPTWYTLQPGGWTSATRWSGTLYRSTGPYFAGPGFDPRLVLILPAGTATLDFEQTPGTVGQARFTYTVNGVTTGKTIQRMRF